MTTSCLNLISEGSNIVIDAFDPLTHSDISPEVFKGFMPGYPKERFLNTPSRATKDTPIEVWELRKDASFTQMFHSFFCDLEKVSLTLYQITKFCEKHSNWLESNGAGMYGTFFLLKKENTFSIIRVFNSRDGLLIGEHFFDVKGDFPAENRYRVIVPQCN